MMALALLGFIALTTVIGARITLRGFRAFSRENKRVNNDIKFLRAIPADMEWGQE